MAGLVNAIEGILAVLKGGEAAVYSEYEKIPVCEHEDIYAAAGISKIVIENGYSGEAGEYYSEKYSLRIRILGKPDTPPAELYEVLDTQLLDRLAASGYAVSHAEISAPLQDNGLKRLVLECKAEISGRTEEKNESQS